MNSTEIETFPIKMEIASTIQVAFKTSGYSTVLVCVWVFSSPKDYQMAARDSSRCRIYISRAVSHITAAIHLEHSFGRKDFLSAFLNFL